MATTTRALAAVLAPIAVAAAMSGCGPATTDTASALTSRPGAAAVTPAPGRTTAARVVRVVDGDTLIVAAGGRRKTIRLIGVDAPETVKPHAPVGCYGPQASALTKSLATTGAPVTLESDPVVGDTDRYGRTLAYVYLADSSMLDERLLQAGAAREYDFDEQAYRYRSRFVADQAQARLSHTGLWGQCPR